MKKLNQIQLKIVTLVSLICVSIPLSICGLWIYVFYLGTSQVERVAIFHDYLPDVLSGRWDTTYLSILFCISSIILSLIGLNSSSTLLKVTNILIVILSSILLLLNLWSMM
jgi:hypothetical protein